MESQDEIAYLEYRINYQTDWLAHLYVIESKSRQIPLMGVNIGIPRRTNAIHGRLTDVVLDGFTYDISYSYFSYKKNE